MFCSHTSLYRIAFVGHMFFKCDEMRLSSFFTVKTPVILVQNSFAFLFIAHFEKE